MLLKNMVVMKICVFGALLACPCRVTAEEEEPMQGLKIESKTHEYSADYHIAKEEGQNPDEDEDKKRTCVGMGEKVTLTLTEKKALVGEDEDIRWSLDMVQKRSRCPINRSNWKCASLPTSPGSTGKRKEAAEE